MLDKNRVVVGMSGGVDSTVAAYLLKQQGYEVIGVTMKLWDDNSEDYVENYGGCCGLSAIDDARRVATALDIPFYVINFKTPFKHHVIDYFTDAYKQGETPNPCVMCNKHIKFDALLEKAKSLGAFYIATGHYAKVQYDPALQQYRLYRSQETAKDQTYMLACLNQAQLAHVLFPLGAYDSKEEVRAIAERLDYVIANKSDSQEICFIPDNNYAKFVVDQIGDSVQSGNFVDLTGQVIGQHNGIVHYTIGQRKGLGVTFGRPMYVVAIDASKNEVVLGEARDVFYTGLIAREMNWICPDNITDDMQVGIRIRHTQTDNFGHVQKLEENRCQVIFDKPVRAVTPGQAIAFYNGEEVLGGGFIERALKRTDTTNLTA